jgi:hypothetical protein
MPSFGISTNITRRDNGYIKGDTYHIACMAWYAPGQPPLPLLLKFEGHDGIIQTVKGIKVTCIQDKYYDGIKTYEYKCEAVIGGIKYVFKLLLYILSCQWIMLI